MDCVIWQRLRANDEPVRLKFDDYMTILPMIARPRFPARSLAPPGRMNRPALFFQ